MKKAQKWIGTLNFLLYKQLLDFYFLFFIVLQTVCQREMRQNLQISPIFRRTAHFVIICAPTQ